MLYGVRKHKCFHLAAHAHGLECSPPPTFSGSSFQPAGGVKGDAWRHPLFFERHEVEYSHFTFLKNIWSNMHTFTILIMHTLPFFTFDWPEITIHIDTLDAREHGKSE